MDTAIVIKEIDELPAEPTPDQFGELLSKLDYMARAIKEARARVEQVMLERIEETKQPIVIGDMRYVATYPKTTKCRDPKKLLQWFFECGDLDSLAACLSSSAFKHGACKEPLGEAWDDHFVVETKAKLEGKELSAINTKFIK